MRVLVGHCVLIGLEVDGRELWPVCSMEVRDDVQRESVALQGLLAPPVPTSRLVVHTQ